MLEEIPVENVMLDWRAALCRILNIGENDIWTGAAAYFRVPLTFFSAKIMFFYEKTVHLS